MKRIFVSTRSTDYSLSRRPRKTHRSKLPKLSVLADRHGTTTWLSTSSGAKPAPRDGSQHRSLVEICRGGNICLKMGLAIPLWRMKDKPLDSCSLPWGVSELGMAGPGIVQP